MKSTKYLFEKSRRIPKQKTEYQYWTYTEVKLSYARSHQHLGTQINIRLGVLYINYKLFKYFRGPLMLNALLKFRTHSCWCNYRSLWDATKFFYASPALWSFYETEFKIWAVLSRISFQLIKEAKLCWKYSKANSVQEPCVKCLAVHILKFEILQTKKIFR